MKAFAFLCCLVAGLALCCDATEVAINVWSNIPACYEPMAAATMYCRHEPSGYTRLKAADFKLSDGSGLCLEDQAVLACAARDLEFLDTVNRADLPWDKLHSSFYANWWRTKSEAMTLRDRRKFLDRERAEFSKKRGARTAAVLNALDQIEARQLRDEKRQRIEELMKAYAASNVVPRRSREDIQTSLH